MKDLWKVVSSPEKLFKVDGMREVNVIGEDENGARRLSLTLELGEVTAAGMLSAQNSVFKTLFAIDEGNVDANGDSVYRGMHRTLFAAIQKLGDKAIGQKLKATVAKVVTSVGFYAMRKNAETGVRELFRGTNGDPIIVNSFEVVYIDGESRVVDQLIEAQIRQIVRDGQFGGGFVEHMHLDSDGNIVPGVDKTPDTAADTPETPDTPVTPPAEGVVPGNNNTPQANPPSQQLQ